MKTLLAQAHLEKKMAGFEDKVVVVTGSSGIGLGAALHLAREGAKVYVCDIDGSANDKARQKANGLDFTVSRVDVSDPDQVQEWIETIVDHSRESDECSLSAAVKSRAYFCLIGLMVLSEVGWAAS